MLRVNRNTLINDDKIECICEYGSKPLVKLARDNEKENRLRKIKGGYGYNSLIVMDDGYLYICQNHPEVYFKRMDMDAYIMISAKRHAVKKSMVREIVTKTNAGQRRDISKAKKEGRFFNLSGNKKTFYYIFTINEHFYGTNTLWDMRQLTKGVISDEKI